MREDGPGTVTFEDVSAPPRGVRARITDLVGVADLTAGLAGLVAVGIFLFWFQRGAGYAPSRWLPGGLVLAGMLGAVVVGTGCAVALDRVRAVSVGALGAFAVWSLTSIAWAGVQGDAWDGGNRDLLYTTTFALFLVLPWTPRSAYTCVLVYGAGVTVLGAAALVHAATSSDQALFVNGSFAYPTGYPNANVIILMFAFWIALAVGREREQLALVRALALASAAFLPQLALLSGARASLVAVPATALVVLAMAPGRLRTLVALAFGLVPVSLTWDVHQAVFEKVEKPPYSDAAVHPSARWMAITSAAVFVGALAWALADRRIELSRRSIRAFELGAAAIAVAVVLAGGVVVSQADPVDRIRHDWHEFTTKTTGYEEGGAFGSFGSERYDIWRVAVRQWREHPVRGIGADNFAIAYLREGHTEETPRYPHSLELGVLSQLGVVGVLLFATFAGIATVLARPRRSDPPLVRIARVAAFSIWIYWLLHASVDWFLEIPGVSAPAFAFVGLAASLALSRAEPSPARGRGVRLAIGAAATALVLALVVSFTPSFLAARHVDLAVGRWSVDPAGAYKHLDRARALNPLSAEPDVLAGAIASRRGETGRMRRSFQQALERDPYSWYSHLELGLAYVREGRGDAALREVARAVELNPREPILVDLLAQMRKGEPISPKEVDRELLEKVLSRIS